MDRITHDDRVLFLQAAFRALMDAMAHPGVRYQLPEREQEDTGLGESPFFDGTVTLAEVLLDVEVSYTICAIEEDMERAVRYVASLTYSATDDVTRADFLFVTADADRLETKRAIRQLKGGTLPDPHSSATVIVECRTWDLEGARAASTGGNGLLLTGPGIETEQVLVTDRPDWLLGREERQDEYPLGVDIILVGDDGAVVAIPRTTHITVLPLDELNTRVHQRESALERM